MCQCVQTCSGKCVKPECKPKPIPHKHAELIKAWADGAKIQCKGDHSPDWADVGDICGWYKQTEYRIKPEVKPDIVCYGVIAVAAYRIAGLTNVGPCNTNPNNNVKITMDGETGKLKSVELIK